MTEEMNEALKAFLAENNPEVLSATLRSTFPVTALLPGSNTILHCAAESGNVMACRVIVAEAWRKYLTDETGSVVLFASPASLQKTLDAAPDGAVILLQKGTYSEKVTSTKEVDLYPYAGDVTFSGTITVTSARVHLHDITCTSAFKAVWAGTAPSDGNDVFLSHTALSLAESARRGRVYKAVHDYIEQKNDQNDTAFLLAVRASRPDVVELFLDLYAPEVNRLDSDGLAPLHIAASVSQDQKNAEAIAELLIEHGAKVSLASRMNGMRPIHFAARAGSLAILKLLLWHGASLNERDDDGATPLHLAAEAGETEMIRYCLANTLVDYAKDDAGRTALHQAALHASPAIVKELLDRGYDPNVQDADGATPLHLAAEKGSTASLTIMLHAATPDVRNSFEEKTAFHVACLKAPIRDREAFLTLFVAFVTAGYSLEATDAAGMTPLDYASKRLNQGLVMSALANRVNLNPPSMIRAFPHETRLLVNALGFEIEDLATKKLADAVIAKRNLEALADVRKTIGPERYPLLCEEIISWSRHKEDFIFPAAANGDEGWVLKLLTDRASVNAFDDNGKTLLYYALVNGMIKLADKLLRFGAAVETVDMLDQSALSVALACDRKVKPTKDAAPLLLDETLPLPAAYDDRYVRLVKLLLKAGANPNLCVQGHTYLFEALRLNDGPLFCALVEGGADPWLVDAQGHTLYDSAYQLNNPDPLILNVLREARHRS